MKSKYILCVFVAVVCVACTGTPVVPAPAKHYRILVTNDDGIEAPGIAALAAAMRSLGEVVVVAPRNDQSGTSNATSILGGVPAIRPVERDGVLFGNAVDGTPADCVLAALYWLDRGRKFDLVVSGINRGMNGGIGSLYSGTVGAALEGALAKIPSIAFSQDSQRKEYATSAAIAAIIAARVLKEGLAPYTFLNVNIPAGKLKGVKVAPMGDSLYVFDHFDTSAATTGAARSVKPVFKRATTFTPGSDTQFYAEGYVTIAPLQADWTAHDSISRIRHWSLELPATVTP